MPIQGVDLYTDRSSLLGTLNDGKLFNTSSIFADRKSGAAGGADSGAGVTSPFANQTFTTQGKTTATTVSGSANLSFGASKFVITTRTTTEPRFGYLDYNTYNATNEEPNRLQRPSDVIRGSFGAAYIRFDNTETYPYADGYQITANDAIVYNEGEDVPYGVIRVDLREGPDNLSTLVSRSSELVAFVSAGGVLWITSEFVSGVGPGTNASTINPVLSGIYGLSMTYNDDIYDAPNPIVQINNLLYGQAATTLPAIFLTDATRTINGGTPLYGSNGKVVAAFEPLGAGYVVLTGDSNGTAQDPDVDSEDSWVYSLRRFNLV